MLIKSYLDVGLSYSLRLNAFSFEVNAMLQLRVH